jgi:hypothetical protein
MRDFFFLNAPNIIIWKRDSFVAKYFSSSKKRKIIFSGMYFPYQLIEQQDVLHTSSGSC